MTVAKFEQAKAVYDTMQGITKMLDAMERCNNIEIRSANGCTLNAISFYKDLEKLLKDVLDRNQEALEKL